MSEHQVLLSHTLHTLLITVLYIKDADSKTSQQLRLLWNELQDTDEVSLIPVSLLLWAVAAL